MNEFKENIKISNNTNFPPAGNLLPSYIDNSGSQIKHTKEIPRTQIKENA